MLNAEPAWGSIAVRHLIASLAVCSANALLVVTNCDDPRHQATPWTSMRRACGDGARQCRRPRRTAGWPCWRRSKSVSMPGSAIFEFEDPQTMLLGTTNSTVSKVESDLTSVGPRSTRVEAETGRRHPSSFGDRGELVPFGNQHPASQR